MAKTNEVIFYLEKRKDKETKKLIEINVPIVLLYSFSGMRLQHFTGYRVDKGRWNEETQRVKLIKHPKSESDRELNESAKETNDALEKLASKVKDIHKRAIANEEFLTLEIFRERIKGGSLTGKKSLQEAWDEYIKECALVQTKSTTDQKKSNFKLIEDFAREKKIRFEFGNINMDFYNKFLEHCFNTDHDYRNSFTGTLIRVLKAFLNWATEKKYNTLLDFRLKSFKRLREEPEIIFLTWDELMKLYKHKFAKKDKIMDEVRDLFCFGCFTGLRFSDITALEKGNVHNGFINYKVVKTNQNNTIPLNPYTRALLEKYKTLPGSKALPDLKKNEANTTLKDVFFKVKLKRKIHQTHLQGAKRIKSSWPLHENVTFHVSKKTFMTNFLARGGKLETAMAITGNKDYRTARRYFTVVDTLKSDQMALVFGK